MSAPSRVQLRLTLAFAVVMSVVLLAAGLFVHQRLQASLDADIARALRSRAADVAALATQSDSGLRESGTSGSIGREAQFAQLIDRRGHVVDATAGLARRPLVPQSTVANLSDGGFATVQRALVDGRPVRILATPVHAQGQRLAVVVGASLTDRDRALADLTGGLLLGGPLVLLLASAAGLVLIGRALRPVEAMRRRERAFVADASHELRTPLTTLRTELELIARERPTGAELEDATGSAIEEVDRLSRLSDDLLLLTRADHGEPALSRSAVAVAELLDAAAARAQRRAPDLVRRIMVTVAPPPGGLVLSVDRARVDQALDNLVDNALRHTASAVELSARAAAAAVELHVRDDGAGFPASFLPRAWDRFARAEAARSADGSGLGLAIVRTVARLHGGDAHAVNRPGGGADVWIALPRPRQPAPTAPSSPVRSPTPPRHRGATSA